MLSTDLLGSIMNGKPMMKIRESGPTLPLTNGGGGGGGTKSLIFRNQDTFATSKRFEICNSILNETAE